jgi:tetratricopeptide (TPR) repeat protein
MFKAKLKREAFLLTGLLCLTTLVSYGQQLGGDLGSSSTLFKNTKPKTTTTTSKSKKPAAKKPAASTARNNTASNKKPVVKKPVQNSSTTAAASDRSVFTATPSVSRPVPSNVEDLFEQALESGNTARDDRNYNIAESAYRKAQDLKPRDARAAYGLGNLYSDLQRWEESEKSYRQAIALDPNAPEAYVALSFVLTQPIAGADVADRYVEAERMTRRALSLDNDNAVAYDQLGTALELQGKIGRETEDAYRRAVSLAPGYALPYAHLGRLKGRNNQVAESRTAYQTAQQLAIDAPSMILVADTLQSFKPVEAEQLLRRALQLDPRNPMALFILSDVLSRQQKMAEAEKVLRDSIQISQNSYTPHSKLGDLFLQLRRYEEAEASFLKALQTASPTEKTKLAGLQGFTGVGDGFMKVKKFRDAVRAYAKAKQIDPQNTEVAAKLTSAERVAF